MTDVAELSGADGDARRAAEHAGVTVRTLDSPAEMSDAAAVLRGIWSDETGGDLIHPALMVALAHGGNYAAGAFAGDRLVAVCFGFFTAPLGQALHSHVAGVVPGYAGRGVGTAVKLHQRQWCLRRDIGAITWTFDPLVARNAYFNLHRLGVRVTGYLDDYYGEMHDAVNEGQATDRLTVRWRLGEPVGAHAEQAGDDAVATIAVTPDGLPVVDDDVLASGSGRARTVAVPPDVETLRRLDPGAADAWRAATRRSLAQLLGDGWQAVDFDRSAGYVLVPS